MINKKLYIKDILFYLFVWIAYLFLSCFAYSRGDDFVFGAGIERYGSFIGWVKFFSTNWGGRIIPQGLLVILLQLPEIVFHLFDATMWVLLIKYVCKVFDYKGAFDRKIEFACFSVFVFLTIPAGVLNGTVFWKCANVLYLWGTAGALVMFYPFICVINEREYKKFDVVAAFVACIYTSSFEQAAVFMSAAAVVFLGYLIAKTKKVNLTLSVLTTISCVLTVVFYKLPGNTARKGIEVLCQLPKYDMFTTTDKILLGIKYAVERSETQVSILYFLLALVVFVSVRLFRKEDKLFLLAATGALAYFLVLWLYMTGKSIAGISFYLIDQVYLCVNVDTVSFSFSMWDFLLECLNIGMLTLLGIMLMLIRPGEINPIIFVSYFGGIATMAIMGFSPTVYASGDRPCFIGCLMLLCTLLCAVSELSRDKLKIKPLAEHEANELIVGEET